MGLFLVLDAKVAADPANIAHRGINSFDMKLVFQANKESTLIRRANDFLFWMKLHF
jgi:hypothetical protein